MYFSPVITSRQLEEIWFELSFRESINEYTLDTHVTCYIITTREAIWCIDKAVDLDLCLYLKLHKKQKDKGTGLDVRMPWFHGLDLKQSN